MYSIDLNYLDGLIKEAQNLQEDPIKIAIQNALQSSCTLSVIHDNENWSGSGFHIGNGYVATVAHVAPQYLLNSKYQIHLTFDGKTNHKAVLMISSHDTDTAILFCEAAKSYPAAELGDSNKLEKGDIIAVIGAPEGWHDTASVGRISNTHQSLGDRAPDKSWHDMIFIDAETQQGSSGGMMIATDGKVYGLVQGVVGENAEVSVGERVVCPINKLKNLLKMLEPKPQEPPL